MLSLAVNWSAVTAIATAVLAVGLLGSVAAAVFAAQQVREARRTRGAQMAVEFFRRWSEHDLVQARQPSASGVQLVTAPAASPTIATLLSAGLAGTLRAAGVPVEVSSIHQLAPGDPSGAVGYYVVIGWVIAGYMSAILLGAVFGPLPARPQMAARFGTLTVIALVVGFSGAALGFAIAGLPGSLAWSA